MPGTKTCVKAVPDLRRRWSYLYLKPKKVTKSNPTANSSVCCMATGCAGGMGSGTAASCACHGPAGVPLPSGKNKPRGFQTSGDVLLMVVREQLFLGRKHPRN